MGSKMKVLLTADVEHVGKAGELKVVSGGFGRNYLMPKGLAVIATPGQIRVAEERMAADRRRAELARKDAQALAGRINGVTLRFTVKVGEQDRLYGSVTNADIAEQLKAQTGVEIDRRKIDLDESIKRTGIYPVQVRLMADLVPVLNVIVEGEGGPAPEAAAEPEAPAIEESTDEDAS